MTGMEYGFKSLPEAFEERQKVIESGDKEAIARMRAADEDLKHIHNETLLFLAFEHLPLRRNGDRNT